MRNNADVDFYVYMSKQKITGILDLFCFCFIITLLENFFCIYNNFIDVEIKFIERLSLYVSTA